MREIEVKFLEIDEEAVVNKLHELGVEDKGKNRYTETIFYD